MGGERGLVNARIGRGLGARGAAIALAGGKRQQAVLLAATLLAAATAAAIGASPPGLTGSIALVSDFTPDLHPDVYEVRVDGGGRRTLTRRPLTEELLPVRDENLTVSPDLRHIAYTVRTRGSDQVIIARRDGARARPVASYRSVGRLAWSPDSRLLAVEAGGSVIVVSLQAGAKRVGQGSISAWSPDSRLLALSVGDGRRIVVRYPDGRQAWTARGAEAVWSPDSSRMALLESSRPVVTIMRADGSLVRRIHDIYCAEWSPRGDLLAECRRKGSTIADRDGRIVRRVEGWFASWEPQGERYAFWKGGDVSTVRLVIAEPSGKRLVDVEDPQRSGSWFNGHFFGTTSWSKDGTHVAVEALDGSVCVIGMATPRPRCAKTSRLIGWSPIAPELVARVPGEGAVVFSRRMTRLRTLTLPVQPEELVLHGVTEDGRLQYSRRLEEGVARLFVAPLAGGRVRLLTPAGRGYQSPAWSPNGLELVAVRQSTTNSGGREIVIVPRGGGRSQPIAAPIGTLSATPGAAWSPTGDRVAYLRADNSGNRVIVAVPRDGSMTGSASWPLAKDTVVSSAISWSPDGRAIAFARRDGIYALDTGTGQVSRLAAAPAATPRFAVSPAWSPDGSRIAFRGGDGIYALTVATGDLRRLAATRQSLHQVAWSPDGRWIVFDADDERCDELNLTLYLVSAEGGASERLSATPPCIEARSPSWSSR